MVIRCNSHKTIYELEVEDFEKLFCCRCFSCMSCSRKPTRMETRRALVEVGLWEKFCRKRDANH